MGHTEIPRAVIYTALAPRGHMAFALDEKGGLYGVSLETGDVERVTLIGCKRGQTATVESGRAPSGAVTVTGIVAEKNRDEGEVIGMACHPSMSLLAVFTDQGVVRTFRA